MCLIAWRWQPEAKTPLVLVANRDEFYSRPTAPLARWPNSPIIAGRDLEAGGSWLGVTAQGRLAAVTNYRDPQQVADGKLSRGTLVRTFLESTVSASEFLTELSTQASCYNPFNLLVFDSQELMGFEGRGAQSYLHTVSPGFGCLSNADFVSAWPKVVQLQTALATALDTAPKDSIDGDSDEKLLSLLHNTTTAPDDSLPATGISLELERALSAIFVNLPNYGTRASSVVYVHRSGVHMVERSFDAKGMLDTVVLDVVSQRQNRQ